MAEKRRRAVFSLERVPGATRLAIGVLRPLAATASTYIN
jgi:hypothetical protein